MEAFIPTSDMIELDGDQDGSFMQTEWTDPSEEEPIRREDTLLIPNSPFTSESSPSITENDFVFLGERPA